MSGIEFLAASRDVLPRREAGAPDRLRRHRRGDRARSTSPTPPLPPQAVGPAGGAPLPGARRPARDWRRPSGRRRTCGSSATAGRPAATRCASSSPATCVPYRWLDLETDPRRGCSSTPPRADAAPLPLAGHRRRRGAVDPDLPTVAQTHRPAGARRALGLRPRRRRRRSGGSGGRGLRRLGGAVHARLECNAPGGQAGTTSRIENYLGFPVGLSGADLTLRARSRPSGSAPRSWCRPRWRGLRREDPYTVIRLADGSEVSASTLLIASGVNYRTPRRPGRRRLTGMGVYYGAGRAEGRPLRAGGRRRRWQLGRAGGDLPGALRALVTC